MGSGLLRLYQKVVIDHPVISLVVLFILVAFFAAYAPNFKLDASSESIVLENDLDLRYYRETREIFGSDDFLIITYTPFTDLLSETSLDGLQALRDQLAKLPYVQSVITILDVPLVNSPKVAISDLTSEDEVRTLETPGIDKELVRREFLESPIYQNNLVSLNGQTTALQVIFTPNDKYRSLLKSRNDLQDKQKDSGLTSGETQQLKTISQEFKDYHAIVIQEERENIKTVRAIIHQFRDRASIHLGGARMITSDMISFIEHDITVFGIGVVGFLILALSFFFRTIRWVALPMSCCLLAVSVMVGFLGFWDWPVTVISSNFISLMLIITMSLTIHLIVRYRILVEQNPEADQKTLVLDTMRIKAKPSFYTAITTIVAFGSLIVCDIRPVIDFGWMMTIGIASAFILNFIYFPAVLTLLAPERVITHPGSTTSLTKGLADFTLKYSHQIILGSLGFFVLGIMGIVQLEVENRFIDHFKSTTEIYQGMELIDTELGGTIPLDVVIKADEEFYASLEDHEMEDDLFDDPFAEENESDEITYWFNGDMLDKVEEIHDYFETIPEIGKVLSIATGMKVFKQLDDGEMPDDYELAVLRKLAPEEIKKTLIHPYLSSDGNQTRITMRLIESAPTLKRKALIQKVNDYLVEDMNFDQANVRPTGLAVLYNNLLQSLYTSQILTLGLVFISILVMFMILFRGITLSLLAILPNLLAASMVLGLMGWLGIPLDMMTITIASITIGIAVDDTIHYIHRFQVEFEKYGNYRATLQACHGSIGISMYYTSLTITAGFSILALSSFIPTIYFGLLTGFAMVVALMSDLTFLPALLTLVKPLGPEKNPDPLTTP